MKASVYVVAIAILLNLSSEALAVGAIAIDDRVGETTPGYGFALGRRDKEEARRAAMAECRRAGNNKCEFKVWFESCGAYAASKRYYGVGWGGTAGAAKKMALQNCGRPACEIKIAKCE